MKELERIEIAALADLYTAVPPAPGGAVVERVGSATLFLFPGTRSISTNRLVGLGVDGPADGGAVVTAAAMAAARRLPWYVSLAPFAQPAMLRDDLVARGFAADYAWMKFRRPAGRPQRVDTALSVRWADRADRAAFASVVTAGFELPESLRPYLEALPERPGWRCFLAWDGDRPVAAGALFVAGDLGWLGLGATLDSHRRRGAQSALLAARIREAGALGARTLVVETGERRPGRPDASYRNLLRAGFSEAYVRGNLRAPG